MKALLLRHAAAIARGTVGILDDDRPLSSSGEVRFRGAARGLARIAPRPDVLLTSPVARALATAQIAALAFTGLEPVIDRALADQSVEAIVARLSTHPHDATVALVGHEPVLGALLGRMLGSPQPERLAFKKGGAALVDLPDGPGAPGRLIWFIEPRVLRALANGSGRGDKAPSARGHDTR